MDGDTLSLFSNPLKWHPDYDSLIVKVHDELAQQETLLYPADSNEVTLFSSACWRGYIAEWIIQNDSVFLSNIYHCHDSGITVNLENIFEEKNKKRLFAFWVTGDLVVPRGKIIQHINIGYESIFENEIILQTENGILKKTIVYQNQLVKESVFYEQASPNEISEFIYSNIHWDKLPDFENKTFQVQIGIQPNEQGQIDHIISEKTFVIIYPVENSDDIIVSDMKNPFIKEGIRIAKLIPDWTVIYQRGEIKDVGLMLLFSEEMKDKYARK